MCEENMAIWKKKTQNPNIVNKYGRYNKILISENEVTGIDSYVKNNLIDSIGNIFLRVVFVFFDTDSTNITLRKVNVKPYGFDKMYMEKDLVEHKLYQIIYHSNERKITPAKFYSIRLNKMHPFDGNGRTCKVSLASDDKIIKFIDRTNNLKS